MASSRLALALGVAALAACSAEQALPPPAPASVEPAIGYRTSEIPATIRGAAFHVRVEQSVEGASGTRVLAGFRAWLGDTELLDVTWVDAETITATIPAGIAVGTHALVVEGPYGTRGSAPAAYEAIAGPPPLLVVTAVPVRNPVTVGDDALFDVIVTNAGPGAMRNVAPNVKRVVGGTRRDPVAGQPPVDLAEGASFTWRHGGPTLEPGELVYEAKASAIEVRTGAGVSSEKVGITFAVQTPPALSIAASLDRPVVTAGDGVTAAFHVTNAGAATARLVASLEAAGTATFGTAPAQEAFEVPGGATVGPLAITIPATGAGTSELRVAVAGVDVNSGDPVGASSSAGSLVVLPAPVLRASLLASGPDPAAPALIPVGAAVRLTMTVVNVGEGRATNVRPTTVAFDPRYPLAHGAVSSATQPFDLPPGAAGTIVWSFDVAEEGAFAVTAGCESDAGHATAEASAGGAVSAEVAVLAWDPFGAAGGAVTTAPALAVLGRELVVGPDRSGTSLARVDVNGGAVELAAVRVAADGTGPNVAANAAALGSGGEYPTFGAAGCGSDGIPATCGPDGEIGLGLLASGLLDGEERLVYGGARAGHLDYVYLARREAPLFFAYVDLSAVLPAEAESLSAALPAGDRLYLGFAAADRPALVVLRTLPAEGGLDATLADATDLGLGAALATLDLGVPVAPAGRLATVDALRIFEGHLYVFGSFGCLVASDATPAGPGAFSSCTRPSSKAAVTPPDAIAVRPGERAHPQVAVWGGRLLAARNTTRGPQLLACTASGGADPGRCEPGDWSLVAPNVADLLDASLTQLDDSANERVALLLATERYLYVGYEGSAGVRVYRTASTALSGYVELTGAGGASAGPGVPGLGGDGFGLGATRVYGALAVPDPRTGASAPVLLVGDGAGPARLVRLLE